MTQPNGICNSSVMTRFGRYYIAASHHGVMAISRSPIQCKPKMPISASIRKRALAHLRYGARALTLYLSGKRISFKHLSFDLRGYSDFQRAVYEALRKVPYGEIRSYKDLAKDAGAPKASRAVGSAMKKNRIPILLPCHRIIETSGCLGGYSGGLSLKKRLLAMEQTTPSGECK